MNTKRNTTRPDALAAAARRRRAYDLRMTGRTFRQIAEDLGTDPRTAHRDVSRVLADTRRAFEARAEEALALELDRLDALTAAVWPGALAGNLGAVSAALRIMDRRARLLGLDTPPKPAGDAASGVQTLTVKLPDNWGMTDPSAN